MKYETGVTWYPDDDPLVRLERWGYKARGNLCSITKDSGYGGPAQWEMELITEGVGTIISSAGSWADWSGPFVWEGRPYGNQIAIRLYGIQKGVHSIIIYDEDNPDEEAALRELIVGTLAYLEHVLCTTKSKS